MHLFAQGWPWYVSGPFIFAVMALLVLLGKRFGVSSNLESLCSLAGAGRFVDFFRFPVSKRAWNLAFVLGAVTGGLLTHILGADERLIPISPKTIDAVTAWGFTVAPGFGPPELMSWAALGSLKTWVLLGVGGFCVGFGTRWAAGCTSGHGISGMSDLQVGSFIATASFFAGGLLMVHFLFPWLLGAG